MKQTFHGRAILPGELSGPALVSRQGFNTLASFQKAVILRTKKAICADQSNPDLFRKNMTGKVLCMPQTIGSTTGGLVILTIARLGNGPLAMLFSEHIDSLSASGVILADIWENKRFVVIDQLGEEFLAAVQDDTPLTIHADGTVEVG